MSDRFSVSKATLTKPSDIALDLVKLGQKVEVETVPVLSTMSSRSASPTIQPAGASSMA